MKRKHKNGYAELKREYKFLADRNLGLQQQLANQIAEVKSLQESNDNIAYKQADVYQELANLRPYCEELKHDLEKSRMDVADRDAVIGRLAVEGRIK